MKGKTICECCINYVFNEEYNYYECQINLDEDELDKFLRNTFEDCPYFHLNDDYKIVKKQM